MFNWIFGWGSRDIESPSIKKAGDDAETLIERVSKIHDLISKRKDLRPCKEVNELFSELVEICIRTLPKATTKKILHNQNIIDIISSLRTLCSTSEYELESHWASQISSGSSPEEVTKRLKDFPYYENYVDLTRMELSAINAVQSKAPQSIAFIGSGPLPLSSLCLSQALGCNASASSTEIVNIDNNASAIAQSTALFRCLGDNENSMKFVCKDASSPELDLKRFDVVYLAALVGETQEEKVRVLVEVVGKMSAGSLLVIRTAHNLRKLLYPDFDPTTEAISNCLQICLMVHPFDHVVNSVIIGRVKTKGKKLSDGGT